MDMVFKKGSIKLATHKNILHHFWQSLCKNQSFSRQFWTYNNDPSQFCSLRPFIKQRKKVPAAISGPKFCLEGDHIKGMTYACTESIRNSKKNEIIVC